MQRFTLFFVIFFGPTSSADSTKVHLHLHVEYINRNEACVTCWPKNKNDQRSYNLIYSHLYNQANPDEHIKNRGPCNKSPSPRNITARLSVQQGVTVVCRGHGKQSETWINVTVFPLSGDDNDFIYNTTGIDSGMILKCNSTFDHNASCWKLSYFHVSNEDVYCNVNNSVAIISTFTPSLYPDIELEDVPMLLRALDGVYNFDELENSCVKVSVSFLQYSTDITPSVTPESACPQPTPCPEQIPCVEQATDALNLFIQDKPTYVLASFPILVAMFALPVLAIVIVLICLAICLCKQKRCKKVIPKGELEEPNRIQEEVQEEMCKKVIPKGELEEPNRIQEEVQEEMSGEGIPKGGESEELNSIQEEVQEKMSGEGIPKGGESEELNSIQEEVQEKMCGEGIPKGGESEGLKPDQKVTPDSDNNTSPMGKESI